VSLTSDLQLPITFHNPTQVAPGPSHSDFSKEETAVGESRPLLALANDNPVVFAHCVTATLAA
jgi:hypothetical protein